MRSNLSITAGLRLIGGGLTEKYGKLLNFDPSKYCYDQPPTAFSGQAGFIIAGNNPNGTPGVSNSTLTGRQWGFAPRVGVAWTPKMFNNKVVVRAGWGMYYDRGELYTYLSPGVTESISRAGRLGSITAALREFAVLPKKRSFTPTLRESLWPNTHPTPRKGKCIISECVRDCCSCR